MSCPVLSCPVQSFLDSKRQADKDGRDVHDNSTQTPNQAGFSSSQAWLDTDPLSGQYHTLYTLPTLTLMLITAKLNGPVKRLKIFLGYPLCPYNIYIVVNCKHSTLYYIV